MEKNSHATGITLFLLSSTNNAMTCVIIFPCGITSLVRDNNTLWLSLLQLSFSSYPNLLNQIYINKRALDVLAYEILNRFGSFKYLNSSWAKHNYLNLKSQNPNPSPQILIFIAKGIQCRF